MNESTLRDFDAAMLHAALDAERIRRGISWRELAKQIWDQSAELNAERQDHPISPSTLTSVADRRDTSCQHALFMLRWLGRAPEEFLSPPAPNGKPPAPFAAGPDRRPRWDLKALYFAADARRREAHLSWSELASVLQCTVHQLRGIRTARYAIGMRLAMRLVQWLDCPASTFIYPARW